MLIQEVEIASSEAKVHLPRLLREVENGKVYAISRHGKIIARIVPNSVYDRKEIIKLVEDIKAIQPHFKKVTLENIREAKHSGHRY